MDCNAAPPLGLGAWPCPVKACGQL